MTKLQNYFKDFLPMTYREFQLARSGMTANESVVAELLRVCCEEDEVKGMKMGLERILGKPEQVVILKTLNTRTLYPNAKSRLPAPEEKELEESADPYAGMVVVDSKDTPSGLLRSEIDKVGDMPNEDVYDVVEHKENHTVAQVFAANVYATAMRGGNLGAIELLFNYLDGAIADVVRIDANDVLILENYANIAPYEAIKGEDGVYYIEGGQYN